MFRRPRAGTNAILLFNQHKPSQQFETAPPIVSLFFRLSQSRVRAPCSHAASSSRPCESKGTWDPPFSNISRDARCHSAKFRQYGLIDGHPTQSSSNAIRSQQNNRHSVSARAEKAVLRMGNGTPNMFNNCKSNKEPLPAFNTSMPALPNSSCSYGMRSSTWKGTNG